MKTAEEILKEYGYWDKEGLAEWHKDCIIAAMEEYAQQKQLDTPDVMQRSEQLPCERCKKLEFMIENGLGWKDMENDYTYQGNCA